MKTSNWDLYDMLSFLKYNGLIIFLGILFSSTHGYGQRFLTDFKQISTEQGLPGENFSDIIQDKNGIMWFCIEGAGVCRYDGTSFHQFKNKDSIQHGISDNNAYMCMVDPMNKIWIATDHGLNVYTQETNQFKVYYHSDDDKNSISDNQVYTITLTSDSTIWVGTRNGLCRYNRDKDNFTRYLNTPFANSESSLVIYKILESKDHSLWLGTSEGLYHFNPKTQETQIFLQGLTHLIVRELIEDKKGNVWISTARGLNFFNAGTKTITPWQFKNPAANFLAVDGIHKFMFDDEGALWVGTYSQGIVIISPDYSTDHLFREDPSSLTGLKSNHISMLYRDRDKGFWIGTKYAGIGYYNKIKDLSTMQPKNFSIFDIVQTKYITSFVNEADTTFWVGTKFNGLYEISIKNQTANNIIPMIGPNDDVEVRRVQTVYRDKNNNLWIGTDIGLIKYDRRHKKSKLILEEFINDIVVDENGTVWVGTFNGTYQLNTDNESLHPFLTNNRFFNENKKDVLRIYVDKTQCVWFGTRNNGLFKYNPQNKQMVHYTNNPNDASTLSDNLIRFIFEDSKNRIWVGTRGDGLNLYHRESNTFSAYRIYDGLSTNFLLNIQEDEHHNLWIGTHHGLSKFNVEEHVFTNFFKDDGFRNNIYDYNASGKIFNKYLLFGGSKGLNIINPDSLTKAKIVSPVLIKTVKSDENVFFRNVNCDESLQVKYKENNLSFEFVVIDYNSSINNQYQCMMEGMDQQWVNLEEGNNITYRNIPAGKYVFKVKAQNSFGNWNVDTPEIKISILPPFYATWYFKILSILFSIIIVYLLYQLRVKAIKQKNKMLSSLVLKRTQSLENANGALLSKNELIGEQKKVIEQHNEELERTVTERTTDLDKARLKAEESERLKSAFLANMSHEIRTPLNAIVGFSSLLADAYVLEEDKETYNGYIHSNTSMLLNIIDDILDISSLESGQLMLHKETFNIKAMMDSLYLQYKNAMDKDKHPADLVLEVENIADLSLFSDENRIKQVISNLIQNALKYTHEGSITLGVKFYDNYFNFYVKDTGEGIPEEYLDSIFNRFTKVEDRPRFYQGNGLGLSISKNLIELLGGKIWLDLNEGGGCAFRFKIPLNHK